MHLNGKRLVHVLDNVFKDQMCNINRNFSLSNWLESILEEMLSSPEHRDFL